MPHKQFFALRNGILADAVRKAGSPCPRIFGLNVPQIAHIARQYGHDNDMARKLWKEKECRESRLLACYLFDPEDIEENEVSSLIADIQSVEEADMLTFRLLRNLPYSRQLLDSLNSSEGAVDPLTAYTAKMLARHLGD